MASERDYLLSVLNDAESFDEPVELLTPKGTLIVEYVELKDTSCWFFVLRRGSVFVFASNDEDLLVKRMRAEGVSFKRKLG